MIYHREENMETQQPSEHTKMTSPDDSGTKASTSQSSSKQPAEDQQKTETSSQQEQEPCAVCLNPAHGLYFGAKVCLPCKTFFIRCSKDQLGLNCSHEDKCDVTLKNRTRCASCRYNKCLSVKMTRKDRPETVVPIEGQKLCLVCNDIANGVHFGVFTCEGCKKFFRKGMKEHTSYVCLHSKSCTLNPRNRNSCKYCRYQMCLNVGMSEKAIRKGRTKKEKPSAEVEKPAEVQDISKTDIILSSNEKTCARGKDEEKEDFPGEKASEKPSVIPWNPPPSWININGTMETNWLFKALCSAEVDHTTILQFLIKRRCGDSSEGASLHSREYLIQQYTIIQHFPVVMSFWKKLPILCSSIVSSDECLSVQELDDTRKLGELLKSTGSAFDPRGFSDQFRSFVTGPMWSEDTGDVFPFPEEGHETVPFLMGFTEPYVTFVKMIPGVTGLDRNDQSLLCRHPALIELLSGCVSLYTENPPAYTILAQEYARNSIMHELGKQFKKEYEILGKMQLSPEEAALYMSLLAVTLVRPMDLKEPDKLQEIQGNLTRIFALCFKGLHGPNSSRMLELASIAPRIILMVEWHRELCEQAFVASEGTAASGPVLVDQFVKLASQMDDVHLDSN